MIGELMKVGDEVVINIPDDNWNWGFRPVPQQNGTVAKIKGFGEIHHSRVQSFGKEPGIYTNYCWVYLEGIEGITEPLHIGSFCLEPKDKDEYERRRKTWDWSAFRAAEKPLRPLPEMKFWEGDIVTVDWSLGEVWRGVTEYKIKSIHYEYLGQMRNDGVTPMPEYDVSPNDPEHGGYTAMNETTLTLVRRGNVWKYFNGEKLEFKDLKEEAEFFSTLGHTEEVRNPACGLYRWNLAEALEAIRGGMADGITVGPKMFTDPFKPEMRTDVYRFKDRELGERVRQATIEGFKDCDAEALEKERP